MIPINADLHLPEEEIRVDFARASGPGGQNVNRRETKARASFDVANSPSLTDDQKQRIMARLERRLSGGGVLSVACDETRSQAENRRRAVERLAALVRFALRKERRRVKTRIPGSQRKKRLNDKRRRGEVKRMRGKVEGE